MFHPLKRPANRSLLSHLWLGILAVLVVAGATLSPSLAEESRELPKPVLDAVAPKNTASETVILAGGCFWGVQGVFQHVEGVTNAVSGYAGGDEKTAKYEIVSSGSTSHAESVSVTFDPQKISYGRILQIYFSVVHDPTELNRQGPDVGAQYRSAIFPINSEQARVAQAYIAQLEKVHVFEAAIVTTIEPNQTFYPAEAYHQDFLTRHPTHPYIVINDQPKIRSLKHYFPEVYRSNPILVAAQPSGD
jgi:peptide-methionine (S)-S-oxide reductase